MNDVVVHRTACEVGPVANVDCVVVAEHQQLEWASTSFANVFSFDHVVGLDLGSDFGYGDGHGFDFAHHVDLDDDLDGDRFF